VLTSFSLSDVGQKRKENQDSVFASESPVGALPNLFIVADGMGGHRAGDYASKATVEQMCSTIAKAKADSPILVLREAITKANDLIYEKAMENAELEGMGTTVVAASVIGDRLQVVNVGDSRLYLISKGSISQITVDHSLVEEMVRVGTIDRETARTHPNKNIITRAIGVAAQVQPDFFTMTVGEGDLILLCSDGLTNMLEDAEILQVLETDNSLEDKGRILVKAANMRGGKDNISVVLIDPMSK